MTHRIFELAIPETHKDLYSPCSADQRIRHLTRLNVFIGSNNSGKSRLLRALFNTNPVQYVPNFENATRIRESVDKCLRAFPKTEIFRKKITGPLTKSLVFPMYSNGTARPVNATDRISSANIVGETLRQRADQIRNADIGIPFDEIETQLTHAATTIDHQFSLDLESVSFQKVYIPTLRGLRTPVNDPMFFRHRTIDDYFPNLASGKSSEGSSAIDKLAVFTGAEIYEELGNYLLGTLSQRRAVQEFERFLSASFFQAKPIALIPRKNGPLFIKIGKEAEQPIQNLGDGIQQIIILTMPMFLHREKDLLLFVEEPELYLHPGFQRIWIETILTSPARSLQVFVATHSHQFMDITVDSKLCSIYKVTAGLSDDGSEEQHSRHRIEFTSNSDFSVLRELGVRNSSVLLSNCTIWVEGITDRLYLRRIIDIVQKAEGAATTKQYFEDTHYSFVEYGGSSITHFSFLEEDGIDVDRLCGPLFLIVDKDGALWKEERHERLRKALGDRCAVLAVREIENLLTPVVISKVVTSFEPEKCAIPEFSQADYSSIGLGDYIENNLLAGSSKRRSKEGRPYAAKSGTLKNKVEFCERAIEEMNHLDDISAEAIALAKQMIAFIADHNP